MPVRTRIGGGLTGKNTGRASLRQHAGKLPTEIGVATATPSWDAAVAAVTARIGQPIVWLADQHTNDGSGFCQTWLASLGTSINGVPGTAAKRPAIIAADPNYKHNRLEYDPAGGVDANADQMVTGVVPGGHAVTTLIFAGHLDVTSSIHKIMDCAGAVGGYQMSVEAAKLNIIGDGATGSDYVAGNTTINAGQRYLFMAEIPHSTLSTDQIKSWVNLTQQTQSVIANTGTNTTARSAAWTISRWPLAALYYWDGGMAVLGAWPGATTADERAALVAGAVADYGVQL